MKGTGNFRTADLEPKASAAEMARERMLAGLCLLAHDGKLQEFSFSWSSSSIQQQIEEEQVLSVLGVG